ncbi:isoaspartyl dipeptidase with L-asparaginase activity [Legionella lansingensis]|uniref:isoaspartyl peptidase/L-asparaginase family protein n=1 Tax=Legionella lansingensis TaxID=45067 RepID=UPI000B17F236|nr:isoaspartyl peptidase/L-asparaginase [Legionella lansingensis]SNV52482.1 isoaspartyl dipeptidase with L-asparaginase activity [Legionella lansingensis]
MKIAIAVHGGAGDNSAFLQNNMNVTEDGLAQAAQYGYQLLQAGGSALQAVEEAVKLLEDNPLFNAGRGSALNCLGEVEMDASIMDGEKLTAGAVSMVREVKNPVSLARLIMERTKHVLLSGYGALDFAKYHGLLLRPDSYFITEHQYDQYEHLNRRERYEDLLHKKRLGTVGAVALDSKGNLAAATSTGGTSNCLPGRVGDSCLIGAGCYANNSGCAVSGTGDGEYLITGVIAHTISMMVEMKMNVREACDHVLHTRNKASKGEIGVISVDTQGEVGIAFNTEIMKRAWIGLDGQLQVKINR